MKKILFVLLMLGSIAIMPTFSQEVKVDYDAMVGSYPYYPILLYPTLSQDVMFQTAIETTKEQVKETYGETVLSKLDGTVARIVATAKTKAETKEGQAQYIGEIVSKIQNVQGSMYGTTTPVLHVLNYLGYKLSWETITLLYGGWSDDVDQLLQWVEG